ncbi:hypothetical protein QN277_015191 [Acacia crassicarpa]|uniref:Uncharacterized protein n=1 Tax=Acacia crassicarpa TaxID=499986 RepID=A0AAE1MT60_9FABA|nr:hypothetical protein QN277_015191 [Acacia crassicarpa]
MNPLYPKPRSYAPQMEMMIPPSQLFDNDRSSFELRALDCNLTSLSVRSKSVPCSMVGLQANEAHWGMRRRTAARKEVEEKEDYR